MDDFHYGRRDNGALHEANISDLPDELLVRIMSYLSLFHRKRLREVSKYWNSISYDRSLIKDDWMVVPTVRDLESLEDRPNIKFINLRIMYVNNDFINSCVWQKFGPMIQCVEIHSITHIRHPVIACIFKYCNNLKSLSIINYSKRSFRYEQPMPIYAPSTLTSITLYVFHRLTDAEFNSLTRHSLRLTRVDLAYCSSLHFENVKNLLIRQSNVLTNLSLSEVSISEEKLLGLLSCVGKQLISLNLSSLLHPLSDDGLIKICELFPNLEEIEMSYVDFTDEGAKTVFCSLKKLKCIDICLTKITDFPLNYMFQIDNLTSINLSECDEITSNGLIAAFTQRPLPKLETLNLFQCHSVSDEVISAISPMIPNIRRLDLGSTEITAFGVLSLTIHNKGLRSLSLYGCSNLNEMYTNTPSINDLEELTELELEFKPGMDESAIQCLSLKRLRKLKLRPIESLLTPLPWPTSCFATLIESCPSLEVVKIRNYIYPEDIDTSALSPRAKKILPLPCRCEFSPNKHLTQICQV